MKSNSYMTRALQAQDSRFARVLGKLGYERADVQVEAPIDELAAARAEYEQTLGKRAFHGWSVAELREKILAHQVG